MEDGGQKTEEVKETRHSTRTGKVALLREILGIWILALAHCRLVDFYAWMSVLENEAAVRCMFGPVLC